MANVLIVAYLLIVLALIAVILLQRSEGGGLGMGSSNANGLISVRGTANLLTRTTAILAALFFASAIALTILSSVDRGTSSILDRAGQGGETPTTVLDAIQQLQQQTGGDLPVPADGTTTTPATPAAPATDGAATPATPAVPAADPSLPVPQETAPAAETPAAPAADAPATTEQPAAPAN